MELRLRFNIRRKELWTLSKIKIRLKRFGKDNFFPSSWHTYLWPVFSPTFHKSTLVYCKVCSCVRVRLSTDWFGWVSPPLSKPILALSNPSPLRFLSHEGSWREPGILNPHSFLNGPLLRDSCVHNTCVNKQTGGGWQGFLVIYFISFWLK